MPAGHWLMSKNKKREREKENVSLLISSKNGTENYDELR